MFNSREYDWASVTIMVGGRTLTGARGISYKRSQEKELLYGKGNEPTSIQRGNVSYEGSLRVLKSELQALMDAGGGTILDMNVNIVVSYGNAGDTIRTDKLLGLEFTEEPEEMNQGDKNSEHELPFIFLRKENG